ncbi:MAG: FecR family protein [candidate division KSB1 bacterium]|jgi:hypothetical protein|nr:FecR family protein [candidate division KSB1 bacterium]
MHTASKLLKLIFIMAMCYGFSADTMTSVGTVSFMIGNPSDVTIMRSGGKSWFPARLNSPVHDGDNIKTGKEARCEIKLKKSGVVRIDEKTVFKLKMSASGISEKSFLSLGKIWMNIKSLFGSDKRIAIQTPTAVCSVRGTIFRVDADSSTRVAVYDGSVDVGPENASMSQPVAPQQRAPRSLKPVEIEGPHEIPPPFEVTLDQWVQIVAGYQIEVRSDGKYAKSKINKRSDAQSDWIRWNQERDGFNNDH